MISIKVEEHPIEIEMPNGSIERSTHTYYLRIPGLPKELRETHIVPGLSHSSLVSIKKYAEEDALLFSKINFVKYGTTAHSYLPGKILDQEDCGYYPYTAGPA